jgi:Tfp pilus assembly protein PilF
MLIQKKLVNPTFSIWQWATSRRYLPRSMAAPLSQIALEKYALYALDLAKKQLQRQDNEAAIANLQEALKCSQSERAKQALVRLLLETEVES